MEIQVHLPLLSFALGYNDILKILDYVAEVVDAAISVSTVTCYDLLDFTWKSEFPSARTTIHQPKVQILNSNLTLFLQTVSTYPTSPWKSQCFVGVRAW